MGQKDISDEAMIKAAKIAQIHRFIMDLPQGYQTPVLQGGANFSGGQKRAFGFGSRSGFAAQNFAFDDATSALDAQTEVKVQENLKKLGKKKAPS